MSKESSGRPIGLMVSSIICSVLALRVIPPLFGGLALYLGYQAYKRDTRIGQFCMALAGMALVIGSIAGFLWGAENLG